MRILTGSTTKAGRSEGKEMLRLSRFLSDGAVLQKEEPIPVWGWGTPGCRIRAVLTGSENGVCGTGKDFADGNGKSSAAITRNGQQEERISASKETVVSADGKFCLKLDPLPAGGPYELHVEGEEETLVVRDLLIGAVWYVSGQSNIDVDMERCYDSYPEVVRNCTDDGLRTFRITENTDYHGPIEEPLTGEWKKAELNTILRFSATGYFFARALREMTGIPVGFIQASLGGSRITSWLSREMLEGNEAYRPLLVEADRYADDDFLAEVIRRNETEPAAWKTALSAQDEGRKNAWEKDAGAIRSAGTSLAIPCCFRDTGLAGFIGCVWLTREFSAPSEMAGKSAGLWLGTMVDSDEVYINGVKVGETGYQYPPRKYRVPEGILRAGSNTITIRLVVENGEGRFTPGKGYFLYNDQGAIDLKGSWFYRIGASCSKVPPTDFVNWKATGLFNGTAAPCFHVPVEGIVWYQGEANTHQPYDYLDLMKRYIEGYRKLWGKEELPFYYVQLPNYDADLDQDVQWPDLREKQRKALAEIPHAGMAVTMDLGEDNDLHPHGKMEIGRRLALLAAHDLYGQEGEYTGPVPLRAQIVPDPEKRGVKAVELPGRFGGRAGRPLSEKPGETKEREPGRGVCVRVTLSHAEGLYADSPEKGSVVRDIELIWADGAVYQGEAFLDRTDAEKAAGGNAALLICCTCRKEPPVVIRYAYHNVMHGAMIYNGAGLPMSPFELKVEV